MTLQVPTLSDIAAFLTPVPQPQPCAKKPAPKPGVLAWEFIADRIDRTPKTWNQLFPLGMKRIVCARELQPGEIIQAEDPRCEAVMNFGCGAYRPDRSGTLRVWCERCGKQWQGYTNSNADAVARVTMMCGGGA